MNQKQINILYHDAPAVVPAQTISEGSEYDPMAEAESFYDDQQVALKNPYAVDKGSIEDSFYGGSNTVQLSSETDLNIIAESSDERAALSQNLGYMASEIGIDQSGLEVFVNITNEYILSGEQANPKSTIQELYKQHGKELHEKLANAQALVQSLPELAAYLDKTGLGNYPKFINRVIKAAESPRAIERINKLKMRAGK